MPAGWNLLLKAALCLRFTTVKVAIISFLSKFERRAVRRTTRRAVRRAVRRATRRFLQSGRKG